MSDELTDEAIWQAVLRGDLSAFATIWDRHHGRVFASLARTEVGNVAEDLTAIVFLQLWRRQRHVKFVDGSVVAWLLGVAKNVRRNEVRARRRHRRFLADLRAELDTLPPPPSFVERAVARETARSALDLVSELDRGLLLATADGATIRQAAADAGVSESAAKMRLSRARRRIRESLDPSNRPRERDQEDDLQ